MSITISPNLIGQLLMQRYLILEPLGSGGFSQTYLAIDTEVPDNLGYVVKLMDAQLATGMSFTSLHRLFETEAYALGHLGGQCDHPPLDYRPVPQLMAYCRDRQQVYLVQELIDGERLDVWMAAAPQPRLKHVMEILSETLLILDYIHRQGIIHCDIKPSNLIRRKSDGKLILIDFGACYFHNYTIAQGQSNDHDDRQTFALGTPGYMPDEQAAGMPDFNSDLYGLGMMMIQILTGIDPQRLAHYPDTHEWNWHDHIRQPLRHLALIPILDRMVRIDPHDRYPSAAAVIECLQSVMPELIVSRLPLFRRQLSRTAPLIAPALAPTLRKGIAHRAVVATHD
jgi:serine/threonine protein kinase